MPQAVIPLPPVVSLNFEPPPERCRFPAGTESRFAHGVTPVAELDSEFAHAHQRRDGAT